jgi:hypothetical protein
MAKTNSVKRILANLIDSIEAAKENNPKFDTSHNIDFWVRRGKEKVKGIQPNRYEKGI